MANPSITSITFDKTAYVKGDTMTVEIGYINGNSAVVQQFTGVATDSVTGQQGSLTVEFTVIDPDQTVITVSDSSNRKWTLVSDTGTVSTWQATA